MRNRTPISIFPFLSVLLSTMGVLSFLAVTFLLFSRQEATQEQPSEPIEVRWVGAPDYVRPVLVECRAGEVLVHLRSNGQTLRFDQASLEREMEVVRELTGRAQGRFGPTPTSTELWLYFKETIPNDSRLRGSFTLQMHTLELDNLTGSSRRKRVERYPILLVYPDGVPSYELASYLVETTSRLSLGLEPMLKGWGLPYLDKAS